MICLPNEHGTHGMIDMMNLTYIVKIDIQDGRIFFSRLSFSTLLTKLNESEKHMANTPRLPIQASDWLISKHS